MPKRVRVVASCIVILGACQIGCRDRKQFGEKTMSFWDKLRGKPSKPTQGEQGPFNAEHEIVIKYFVGDKQITQGDADLPPLRVVTDGLAKRDFREFELVGIPTALNNAAAMVLNAISEYTVNKKRLKDGDTWASRLPDGFVVAARVQEVESFGRRVLRVCDVSAESPDQPAKTAVSAMAVSSARAKHQADQEDNAVTLLKASIDWFPGEPGAGVRVQKNENINQNNNLSYLALASMHVDVEMNYANAIQRSEDLSLFEIGGALPPKLEPELLQSEAAALVTTMQEEMVHLQKSPEGQKLTNAPMGDGVGFLLSPMVRVTGDHLTQGLAIGPVAYRRYYYEEPGRSALRAPGTTKLAAEIYTKWVEKPEVILRLSRDTAVDVYEEGYRFEDQRPSRPVRVKTHAANASHLPLLSRILAALGRDLAAGLSVEELRTRWRLIDDPKAGASAGTKLAEFRKHEDAEIMKSYGLSK